ncbi:uridine kinase [Streptomyces sp. SID14478]|uniref:uridine kinase family protein n=1 Tax=Streptomyces sp. SID14478 TaxID=2706073 RepID=UPI0013DCD8B7|nr:uridine kinase [Streptomyces sp. SID14478]NEB77627.1 uridine kinase [Streptomyces sp. SID14478]
MQTQSPFDLDEVARQIRTRATGAGRRVLVGIDGPGASGKSTFAELLAARLPDARIVHVDDFYRPSDEPRPADGFGPDFDLTRLHEQVLRPAHDGGPIRYQRFDWDTDALAEWHELPDGVPVIVEGVYSTRAAVRDLYTFTVYCETPRALRLSRGLERDGAEAESQWVDGWMPAEDRYTEAEKPYSYADLVVDGTGEPGTEGPVFRPTQLP